MTTFPSFKELNERNAKRCSHEQALISKLLANAEIAERAEVLLKQATVCREFRCSILEIVQVAATSLGKERQSFANKSNAKQSRQARHRIGPIAKLPPDSGLAPFRVKQPFYCFVDDFIRRQPSMLGAIQQFYLIDADLKEIADDQQVKLVEASIHPEDPHPLRKSTYHLKIDGRDYKLSFGTFERRYASVH